MKNRNTFFYIIIGFCIILSSCGNSFLMTQSTQVQNQEYGIVKISDIKMDRTIVPDLSTDTKEMLTNIKIVLDDGDSGEYTWDSYNDLINDDPEFILPIGPHGWYIEGYIGNVLYEYGYSQTIHPGTNYIIFLLYPHDVQFLDLSDGLKEEVNLTVYFPAMTGSVQGKVYIDNNIYTVQQVDVCTESDSEYFGMMYLNFREKIPVRKATKRIQILVEDISYSQNVAAYYDDYLLVASEHNTRETIVIPSLINVYHAFYVDATNEDGSLHYANIGTFTYKGFKNALLANNNSTHKFFYDKDCTINTQNYPTINSDVYLYGKNWQTNDLITVNFVTNCDVQIEPIKVKKDIFYVDSYYDYYQSGSYLYGQDYTYAINDSSMLHTGFAGWYFDAEFTQPAFGYRTEYDYEPYCQKSEDFTLYAKWVDTITVSFETNCDVYLKPIEIADANAKISFKTDFSNPIISTSSEGIQSRIDNYTIQYSTPVDYNGSVEAYYEVKDQSIRYIFKEGYILQGYYFDEDFTNPFLPGEEYSISEDTIIYLKWVEPITINYDILITKEDNYLPLKDVDLDLFKGSVVVGNGTNITLEFYAPNHAFGDPGSIRFRNTLTDEYTMFICSRDYENDFFEGFFLDSDFTIPFNCTPSYEITEEITVYFKYSDIATVNFVTNCDISIPPLIVPKRDWIITADYFCTPVYEEYYQGYFDYSPYICIDNNWYDYLHLNDKYELFDCWCFDEQLTNSADCISHGIQKTINKYANSELYEKKFNISNDITLYAKWKSQ